MAFVLVGILVSGILLLLPDRTQEMELYVFSFGDAVEDIYREIGENIELERAFNTQILASIDNLISPVSWTEEQSRQDDIFLWEDFSEEELKFLESAIKKEKKL